MFDNLDFHMQPHWNCIDDMYWVGNHSGIQRTIPYRLHIQQTCFSLTTRARPSLSLQLSIVQQLIAQDQQYTTTGQMLRLSHLGHPDLSNSQPVIHLGWQTCPQFSTRLTPYLMQMPQTFVSSSFCWSLLLQWTQEEFDFIFDSSQLITRLGSSSSWYLSRNLHQRKYLTLKKIIFKKPQMHCRGLEHAQGHLASQQMQAIMMAIMPTAPMTEKEMIRGFFTTFQSKQSWHYLMPFGLTWYQKVGSQH